MVQKIVITGGAGFIGSHAAERFAKQGNEVIIVDNLSRSQLLGKEPSKTDVYNLHRLKVYKNIEFMSRDICDEQTMPKAAKGADVIIHAAGQTAVTTSVTDPKTDFRTNTVGTFNVLEAARQNNSTVIFTSTNKVYGDNVNSVPITEEATRYRFAPWWRNGIPEDFSIDRTHHSPYGASKLAADLYVQEYAQQYGLRTAVFRMSCIYGTNQFGVEDQGWLAHLTMSTLKDKPIIIYGNGKQVRDVLFVDDLITLMEKFIKSEIKNTVINVGGGKDNTLSLLELLSLLRKETGKEPKLTYADWRPADQKIYVSDITKAENTFGWKPTITPEYGVGKLVAWAKEM